MSEPAAPKLKPHHEYRSWTSTWWEGPHRRTKRFGREGDTTRTQAVARFKHWMQTEFDLLAQADRTLTIARLCDLYLAYARKTFAGSAHLPMIEAAMKALKRLAGEQIAPLFKAHQLATVRDAMIHTKDRKRRPITLSLKTVNGRLYAMKQMFKWAASERGIIPEGVAGAMLLVMPLKRGRSAAIDPKKVRPVEWSAVKAAMKVSPKVLADMIELQWLTGMRSGELCQMRGELIDKREYRPTSHKMQHKGQDRVIPFGPRGWKIVQRYVVRQPFMFSPAESVEQMLVLKNDQRRTPNNQGNRRGSNVVRHPFIKPGTHYTPASYRRAIRYACTRAKIPPWHPHQLRHSFGTRARAAYGFEAASDALGHGSPEVTGIYAERSLQASRRVARKIG